jgi:general stress protein 26
MNQRNLNDEVMDMEREKIIEEVESILKVPQPGIMSTAYGNLPHSRYMMLHSDGRNLYAETTAASVDVDEIRENNLAYIILGYDAEAESSYLEMLAETEVVMNQVTIDWLWDQQDHHDLDVLEEEVMIVLKFIPGQIKLMNANDAIDQPEVLDFTR